MVGNSGLMKEFKIQFFYSCQASLLYEHHTNDEFKNCARKLIKVEFGN